MTKSQDDSREPSPCFGVFNDGQESFVNITGLGAHESSGYQDISNLLLLCQLGRTYALTQPEYLVRLKVPSQDMKFMVFIVSLDMEVLADFYNHAKDRWLDWPLAITTQVLYFTKRSAVVATHIIDRNTTQKLVTSTVKFVYISKESRLPIQTLPSWTQTAGIYGADEAVKRQPKIHQPESIPASAYSYSYRVTYHDIDGNRHTNHAVYPRLCMDAASTMVSIQQQANSTRATAHQQRVKSVRGFYAKESMLGDLLEVRVWWLDEHSENVLYCTITKDDATVYFGNIVFYEYHTTRIASKL